MYFIGRWNNFTVQQHLLIVKEMDFLHIVNWTSFEQTCFQSLFSQIYFQVII